jgi:membrane-associated phospholipid phosphatase
MRNQTPIDSGVSKKDPLHRSFAAMRSRAVGVALAAQIAVPLVAGAQIAPPMPADTGGKESQGPLFTKRDAVIAGALAVTTVLLFPVDREVAQELQNPNTQANKFFNHAATGVEIIASPGAYYIGGALLAFGRATKMQRVADLGWHGTEAVLLGETFTNVLKRFVGRARPYVSDADDPDNFTFAGGFGDGDRRSFPSGHTTTAFAAAAAVTAEVKRWSPRAKPYVATAMYGGAALVGLSRMYHNKHWGSDVALGALIGSFSGWKVVQYSHAHPNNAFDRLMLGTAIVTSGNQVAVGWHGVW